MKQVIIPENKLASYIKYCDEECNKSTVICHECKKSVEIKLHPYFYDEDEGETYFVGIYPNCGELFVIKE